MVADEVRRQTQRSLLSGQDATVDEFLAQFHDSSRCREIEQAWQGHLPVPQAACLEWQGVSDAAALSLLTS